MSARRSWITLHPRWYLAERQLLLRQFPRFSPSTKELDRGVLALVGTLVTDIGSRRVEHPVLLTYPEESPYRPPFITPLVALPVDDTWMVGEVARPENVRRMPAGYRRHQMADGHLCLFDPDGESTFETISATDVLTRAQAILAAVEMGRPFPFPDTEEAELEAQMNGIAGDIVLGEAFYDTAVTGSGMFYAAYQHDSIKQLPSFIPQAPPVRQLLVGAHLTTHAPGGLIETAWINEVSEPMRRAFPWLVDGMRHSFGAVLSDNPDVSAQLGTVGAWWDLDFEPEPFQSVREFEEILQQAGIEDPLARLVALDSYPSQPGQVFAALRYPLRGDDGLREWLFVVIKREETVTRDVLAAEGEGVRRDLLRDARVFALRPHRLERRTLELRVRTDTTAMLHERHVLVVGVGALGGEVADSLAKAGVGRLTLVDFDLLRSANVIRHVGGIAMTGLRKTDAVRHLVLQHNPFVDVEVLPMSVTADLAKLEDLLGSADLAVSTVADENVEMVINEAAVRVRRPVVYGRALRGGTAARVFRVRPGKDACKRCLALYLDEGTAPDGTPWIDIPAKVGEVIGRECGNPILAGSAVDLKVVSGLVAQAVLDELGGGSGWNNLVWTREGLPGAGAGLAQPYSTVRLQLTPHLGCPTCRVPTTAGLLIAEEALESMAVRVEAKPDVETGGILIGFIDDGGHVNIIEATDAGPAATESRMRFERDAAYVQERLEAAAVQYGPRGQYVGEWHSHLEAAPTPSSRDVESLSGIAEAPNYLTSEPVMVIVGLNPATGKVEGLHTSCFPVGRAFVQLPYDVVPMADVLGRRVKPLPIPPIR